MTTKPSNPQKPLLSGVQRLMTKAANFRVNRILRRGHSLIRQGRYGEAHEEYQKARATWSHLPPDIRYYEASVMRHLRAPFDSLELSGLSLQVLVDNFPPGRVLDVGSGSGAHANLLSKHEWEVTLNDYGRSDNFHQSRGLRRVIIGDFMKVELPGPFDVVWMSHVLEHQTDVGSFLARARSLLAPEGWLAVTVPPQRSEIVGGHLTAWTPGLLLYNLVLAGFDGKAAKILQYGYNISIFVPKTDRPLPHLHFDKGDIERLREFLPDGCEEGFDGRMIEFLWAPPKYE